MWTMTASMNDRALRGRTALAVCAAAVALVPGAGWAGTAVRDFQYDAAEHWGARILTWVAVLSLLAIAYTLSQVSRGRANGGAGKALILASAVLLPSFCVATGMVLVFARAERVEFCGSCHLAMDPFVADMTDPSGRGLAAVHYTNRFIPSNQCYECHTSYGLFGTVKAKIHGASQVLRYYGGAFEPPVTLWQPYSNADCLKCHAESKLWLEEPSHTADGMIDELFEDRTSCMGCHEWGHLVNVDLGGPS
jgi:nitrate/TMAO reductase-like tetraheme cytochrome c subunit